MTIRSTVLPIVLICWACGSGNDNTPQPTPPAPNPNTPVVPYADFMRGADLSFLPEIEEEGTIFLTSGDVPMDALTILKDNGCNTIRIRLWHSPASVHSSLNEVTTLAARVKAAGLKVFLDIHYSDTWADPGHQAKPAAWQALSLTDLKDSVYKYTKKVVTRIQPEYVQIGNEVNGGMLWEDGRINLMPNFVDLLKEGCRGSREASSTTKILVHFAGTNGAAYFFSQLKANSVDYDLMGISYYPMWHGFSLDDLKTSINDLIATNNKPLIIAETAYPFTLLWNDYTNNILGESSQLAPGYPATSEGQRSFMMALKTMLKQNSRGAGFCYWGGEWVAFRGPTAPDGSSFENMALFGFNNKEMPAMDVFTP